MTPVPPSSPIGGSRPGGSGGGAGQFASPTPTGFIGRYQILEKIGEGGMGSLYLARDPAIDRLVAIKLLRRGFDTEAVRERFAREARAAGRLRHPHIVTIFDVGEHDGDPFIAMEFLAGETLGELIRQGAGLSLSRRLKLLEELCDGLAYAHRAGLVHRDIKPANLMVDAEGVLKILDFGIVRVSDSGVTQAGVLVGTINYMSPEQVVGSGVDHRSDIFAVGLVAYELLSGRQAFPGTMKDGLLKRIPSAEIEPLATVMPGIDAEVAGIVEHALQRDPADRYQDLARMRNDLARARQRMEAIEEESAAAAAAGSAETALISEEPTAAGVSMEAPRPAAPGFLVDAERALAEGNYRAALSIAGRAAAVNPRDRYPSSIAARAEAGLLDRGRSHESIIVPTPPGGSSTASRPAAAPAPTPSPSTRPWAGANLIPIAVAIVALLVAGFAVWSQMDREERKQPASPQSGTTPAPANTDAPSARPPASPTPGDSPGTARGADPAPAPPSESPRSGPERPAESRSQPAATDPASNKPVVERRDRSRGSTTAPPRTPPRPEPPAPAPPAAPLRAGQDVSPPQLVRQAAAPYPAEARSAGAEGTVGIEVTIDEAGKVADARITRSVAPALDAAALAAVRQYEFRPTVVDGRAVRVLHTVQVPFQAPPEEPKPPASLPGTPRPVPSSPPASKAEEPPKPPPAPPRDLRAEAQTEVMATLKRYEGARESRDFDALSKVLVMSRAEARRMQELMRDTRDLQIEMDCAAVQVSDDRRAASVPCAMTLRHRGVIGSDTHVNTAKYVFELQKRGDAWWIVGLR